MEIVPASADVHAGPRLDGAYISPVVQTIKTGFLWRRKTYRRLALRIHEDGSCDEYAIDFRKQTLPSKAIRVLGSVRCRPGPGDIRDLGDGRIEKDNMTWTFSSEVTSPP